MWNQWNCLDVKVYTGSAVTISFSYTQAFAEISSLKDDDTVVEMLGITVQCC